MKEIVVQSNEAGQRMDKLLAKVFHQCSKGFLYKMLRKKNILLNNQRAQGSERLQLGDTIQIYFSDATYDKLTGKAVFSPVSLPPEFSVLYEDDDVIVMNKWAGVLSQKAKSSDVSMNEYMLSYLLEQGRIRTADLATFTPSICNRLDRNTTGLLLGGVSLAGLQITAQALRQRTIQKYYYALVSGVPPEKQTLKSRLVRDAARNEVRVISQADDSIGVPIETEYETVFTDRQNTLLRVHLITGKTHQIRAQLAAIGHPVIGDVKYGNSRINRLYQREWGVQSQLLHARELCFPADFELEPLRGKRMKAPLPLPFETALLRMGWREE